MRTNLCRAKRQSRTALNQKSNAGASRPYIEGRLAFLPKKAGLQTFLHSQAPSHPNEQWRLCFGAIMEFTAAGQSEILTHIPN
jgi:hypothetical protein